MLWFTASLSTASAQSGPAGLVATAVAARHGRPLPPRATAKGESYSSTRQQDRVLELVRQGASLNSGGADLAAAVAGLVASNTCDRPGPESLTGGQGTWEVFHAPHIARLSAALGARFQPIRYTLRGEQLISNVCYHHPLLGTGWLSASGTLSAADDSTLLVHFDQFWWDLGEGTLRPELHPRSSGSGSSGSVMDAVVGALGRAAFLPQFASFPVEYLDSQAGLAVFRFPPLRSSIAVARRSGGDSGV